MDPIDRIANVFSIYCRELLHAMHEIQTIVDASETTGDAMATIVRKGVFPAVDLRCLKTVEVEIPKLRRCLESLDEIKTLAREVVACNFSEEDQFFVFSQEISFSFAAKMLVSMGLRLRHFSNSPTSDEVVRAEIALAMRQKPVIAREPKKNSIPTAVATIAKRHPRPTVVRMKSSSSPSADLFCHESMPTPMQTRLPLPLQLETSDRR
jgi:hypothetical protein